MAKMYVKPDPKLVAALIAQEKTPMNKPKYLFFWVETDDNPYLVINPPKNFKTLLRQWKRMDAKYCADQKSCPEWDFINVWLKKKGVTLVEPNFVVLGDI